MEAYPDDGLGASIDPQMTFDRALDAVALGSGFYDALGVGDSPPADYSAPRLHELADIQYRVSLALNEQKG